MGRDLSNMAHENIQQLRNTFFCFVVEKKKGINREFCFLCFSTFTLCLSLPFWDIFAAWRDVDALSPEVNRIPSQLLPSIRLKLFILLKYSAPISFFFSL